MLTRRRRLKLWAQVRSWEVRDWLLRWIYAQHNARVIVDFENRMTSVIYEATGGMMSKPYYSADTMLAQIREHAEQQYDAAYADGRNDLALELGVEDPEKDDAAA